MPPDFRQLRYFVQIAETGTFSQAARTLGVAQPALSHHMTALEAHLGVKLFLRAAHGVELTEAGERLLAHAQDILARLARAEDDLRVEVTDLSGPPVAVGLIPSMTGSFAVPMLERLRERYPNFRLRLLEGLSDQILEWLLAGQIQFGFSTLSKHPPRISVEPIVRERLCLVTAPGYIQRRSPTIPTVDAIKLPLILNPRPNSVRLALEEAARARSVPVNLLLEFDSFSVIKEAVRRGFGCTILSWGAVAEECLSGQLASYRLVDPSVSRTLNLISAKEHAMSRSGRIMKGEFVDLAKAFAREGHLR